MTERVRMPSGGMRPLDKVDRATKYLVTDAELDGLHEEMLANGMPPAIARSFTALMVSENVTDVECPHCGKRAKVRYPDWRGYRQLAELILNHLRGKPVERKQIDITARLAKRVEDLDSLTDEELLAIEQGQ